MEETKQHDIKQLEEYRAHSVDNEIEIVSSSECGCFFCRQRYSAREVLDWANDDRGTSAICPVCGIDAVIGDASGIEISKTLLKEMNLAFYPQNVIKGDPNAAKTYCDRYDSGEITHKETNEKLYVSYLTSLFDAGDKDAAFKLAEFYEKKAEFSPINVDAAIQIYASPLIKDEARSLCRIGMIHMKNAILPEEARAAYECFAKAAALGDLTAVYLMSDCYLQGVYVKRDPSFAYKLLESAFGEIDARFRVDRKDWYDYPDYAYRLGNCYQHGYGVEQDSTEAITYYLLAEVSYAIREVVEGIGQDPLLFADIQSEIKAYAKANSLTRNTPINDSDTFFDSFRNCNNQNDTKTFKFVSFSKESGDLEFIVTYPNPQLILDLGSLYCGFASGPVHWYFREVADFRLSNGRREFNNVIFDEESDTWRFVYVSSDGNEDEIASIRFNSRPSDFKE
ncbi:MAG: sel1 repeat family protein [Bacilli bacterium]|nr:sel1 repeat family protein [Bacilli bacterium]